MRRVALLFLGALSLGGCGGEAERDGKGPSSSSPEPASTVEVVDDLNDDGSGPTAPAGASAFVWSGGPIGNWFVTTADGVTRDATIEEIAAAQADGDRAVHVSGTGDGVGLDLWAQLRHPAGTAVDLSAYSAVAFRARLSGAGGTLIVALGADGRFFEAGALPRRTLAVADTWQDFRLSFQEVGLEPPATSSVDFVVTAADEPFELWIDDLSFLCKGACP